MFIVILLMGCGVALGVVLRGRCLKGVHRAVTGLIWLLLFLLGVEVGSDERIVRGLHTLGAEALLLAAGGTLGSVTAAWLLWKSVRRKGGAA